MIGSIDQMPGVQTNCLIGKGTKKVEKYRLLQVFFWQASSQVKLFGQLITKSSGSEKGDNPKIRLSFSVAAAAACRFSPFL